MGKHSSSPMPPTKGLSKIQGDPDLWYRVQVLLYDLKNVGHDVLSEKRLLATTNELYISAPYFTEAEATQILSTLVEKPTNPSEDSIAPSTIVLTATIRDAIHQRLTNFLDKRKASGDARPCGPHDILPIYLDVFKLQKADLKNHKFLGRVRRTGLGDFVSKHPTNDAGDGPMATGDKGKKGQRRR